MEIGFVRHIFDSSPCRPPCQPAPTKASPRGKRPNSNSKLIHYPIVAGLLDRETGKAHATVVDTLRKGDLQEEVREKVEPGSELHTDALKSCEGLDEYRHKLIDHAGA